MVHEWRGLAVDRIVFLRFHRSALIHRVAGHIEYPAHDPIAHRHGYRPAAVRDREASLEAFGARHGDCPDPLVAQMLLHFERHFSRLFLNFVFDRQRVVYPR